MAEGTGPPDDAPATPPDDAPATPPDTSPPAGASPVDPRPAVPPTWGTEPPPWASDPTPPAGPPPSGPSSSLPQGWSVGAATPIAPAAPDAVIAPPPKLQVGSVLGRTLDQLLAHPLEFASLAIPAALIALLTVVIDTNQSGSSGQLALTIVTTIAGIVFSLAMIVASDEVRAGRPIDLGAAIGKGLSRTLTAILSGLAFALAFVGLGILFLVVAAIPLAAGVPAIAGIAGIVFIALLIYVGIRWGLSTAAIVLDGRGPIAGLRTSWRVTRGNALRVVGLYVLIGLLTVPLGFGIGLMSVVAPDARLAGLLGAVVTLLTAPLSAIVTATVYGDLTGRPFDPAANPARPTARWVLVGALVVLGIAGIAIAAPNLGDAYQRIVTATSVADRGVVHFGTAANPTNVCSPLNARTDFATTDSIYIGGYFTGNVPAGGTATESIYANGALAGSGDLPQSVLPTGCFAEAEPLTNAPPGTYRVEVTFQGQTIASGEFTVH